MMLLNQPNLQQNESGVRSQYDIFPISYSTLDVRALITQILNHYPIDTVEKCKFWHRGLSDVYSVKTQTTRYFLRISHQHWRCQDEIKFEVELLDFLHRNQLPVADPIRTTDGKLFLEINAPEGKRYAVLFVNAPGQIAIGDLNVNQSLKLGATVAKIHQVSLNFKPPVQRQPLTLDYLLESSLVVIAPYLKNRPKDLNYLVEVVFQLKTQLENLPKIPPLWGICWGDPHSGNAHFTADDQITLFDFDQCGYGWRSFDIAKFLQVSLQSGLSKKVREAFVLGYEEINPLIELEKSLIQGLTETAHIWAWAISIINAEQFNYSRLDPCYFTRYLEQLKRLHSPDWQ
ncbi:MAG: phosphotransferase [Planktothrix sp.]